MKLSVVIATYNRAVHLADALEHWTKQEAPADQFEIIVVDNGSTDPTRETVEIFRKKHPAFPVKYVFLPEPGLSAARNEGIKHARGDYIAFVDDDARPGPLYVRAFLDYARRFPQEKAFGGPVLPRYETGEKPPWMSRYLQRILSIVDEGDRVKYFARTYPVGCNMIFHKSLFDETGFFDLPPGLRSEDKHFFMKVRRAGYRALYLPEVKVYHFIDAWRLTADYIRKTSFKNGYSDKRMLELFPHSNYLKMKKFADLVFKNAAAWLLWFIFALKGEGVKGKYLSMSMRWTLKGFLSAQPEPD